MARVIFFGTPELAVPTLHALHNAGHEIVLVVTQDDKRRGRGSEPIPSPVKQAANELGLVVTSRVRDVSDMQADVGVLVAFGRLIRAEILDSLRIVNLHPSLLPRWRGATPVEAALLAGDETTGICLMQLVEEMDAGPIFRTWTTEIEADETSTHLYKRLFTKGNELLIELLADDLPELVDQSGEPSYCGKLSSKDFHIDWNRSAESIHRLTRIGRPWTTFRSKRVLVLSAQAGPAVESYTGVRGSLMGTDVITADGVLTLKEVQPEGKPRMDAKAWLNGLRPQQYEVFE